MHSNVLTYFPNPSMTERTALNPTSPLTRWLDSKINRRSVLDRLIAVLNNQARQYPPVVTPDDDCALLEQAADYLIRWRIGDLEYHQTLAVFGAGRLNATEAVRDVIRIGNTNPRLRLSACIALAWFDRVTQGVIPDHLYDGIDAPSLLDAVPRDTRAILSQIDQVIPDAWGIYATYMPTPILAGSRDFKIDLPTAIIDGALYDVRVMPEPEPITTAELLRLCLLALMDYYDEYGMTGIGACYASHGWRFRLSFRQLFGDQLIPLRWELHANLRRGVWGDLTV